jgi:hypothetical protein
LWLGVRKAGNRIPRPAVDAARVLHRHAHRRRRIQQSRGGRVDVQWACLYDTNAAIDRQFNSSDKAALIGAPKNRCGSAYDQRRYHSAFTSLYLACVKVNGHQPRTCSRAPDPTPSRSFLVTPTRFGQRVPLQSSAAPAFRLHRHPAAVDGDHGSVHVARPAGGEEDDRLGDLLRVGGAAKRDG